MIKIIDKMTFDTYKDSKIWRIIVNILESLLSIFCHKKQSKNDIDLAIKYNKFINSIKPLELDNFDSHNEWKNFVNNVLYLSKSKSINTFLTWKPITSSMNVTNSYFLKYEFDYLKNTENW
jgi:hypothetical protein